jgi:hypothetical protein
MTAKKTLHMSWCLKPNNFDIKNVFFDMTCILAVLTFQKHLLPLKFQHLNASQKTEVLFIGTNMKTMVGTEYFGSFSFVSIYAVDC